MGLLCFSIPWADNIVDHIIFFGVLSIIAAVIKYKVITICNGELVIKDQGFYFSNVTVYPIDKFENVQLTEGLGSTGGLVLIAIVDGEKILLAETDIRPKFSQNLNEFKIAIEAYLKKHG